MDGNLLNEQDFAPGLAAAQDGSKLEPEAITAVRDKDNETYLTAEMELGRKGHNIHHLYIVKLSGGRGSAQTPLARAFANAGPDQ
jgi:hypothetical protein